MYTISLGDVVMCMGTNMFMDILLMVIDLCIQICCLCDIMFYAVCVIRKIHSPVILMLCCPLRVITLRGGAEQNDIQHVNFGMRG